MERLDVIAVVDAVEALPIVWWVNVGSSPREVQRLCGAWALDSTACELGDLVAGRLLLPTVAGGQVLAQHGIAVVDVVDVSGTLRAVKTACTELDSVMKAHLAALPRGRKLIPPAWPSLPDEIDVERCATNSSVGVAGRALVIAAWFDTLCRLWDGVESERLARGYLRDHGGNAARLLPVVTTVAAR